jgi:hypothetical protein
VVLEASPELLRSLALDPYAALWPKFVMVIDADALMSSIAHQCSGGHRPRLLRILESNSGRGFAPDHVYGEVYTRLHRFARGSVTFEDLRACFEEHYLPHIRWVDTSVELIDDSRVALVIQEDLSDAPTAQLASLIAPCLVVSGDKHLRRPGVAPQEWRVALGHGSEVVEASGQQEGLTMAAVVPMVAVLAGGAKIGEKLRVPWWGVTGVVLAGGYLVLRDPARRRTIGEHTRPFVMTFLELLADAYERESQGRAGLRELMFQPDEDASAKAQVATVLARAREPLPAAEIHAELTRHFDTVPTLLEVRRVLRDSREFTNPVRYRWDLGRVAGAWDGEL